jgi:hypothetical protein
MKYKISYEDPRHNLHCKYYNALNSLTAKEMFSASVAHSIKEEVKVIDVYRLEGKNWVKVKKD